MRAYHHTSVRRSRRVPLLLAVITAVLTPGARAEPGRQVSRRLFRHQLHCILHRVEMWPGQACRGGPNSIPLGSCCLESALMSLVQKAGSQPISGGRWRRPSSRHASPSYSKISRQVGLRKSNRIRFVAYLRCS